jgi:dTDP-glucose pyrophosphorylase
MENHQLYMISENESIRNAIKKMDVEQIDLLVVVNQDQAVISVFTSGDFRNAVLKGIDINNNVSTIANKNFIFLKENHSFNEALKLFEDENVVAVPILKNGKLIDLLHQKNFKIIDKGSSELKKKNIKTVIMAGGKGTRLDPFTKVLPKPLIPIGDDPIIKIIMDEFISHGLDSFYITLKDKARMIKAYFHDHDMGYKIKFIDENKPLGTAGSLKLLEGVLDDVFFVSNCDIIVKSNYAEVLSFHNEGDYLITVLGSMKQHSVPYGICEIEKDGKLKSITEKPKFDYLVNTGLYVVNPEVIKLIPKDTYFDMTDLLANLMSKGKRVGLYPISEKSWIDVGQWEDLNNALSDVRFK